MIRYLFVDNFRGFSNTYIPLLDVNFFVGENSSGKTSVLGLLKMLSTMEFIWGQRFAAPHVNFGHFDDIVSAHSSDRSSFSFGVIEQFGDNTVAMLYTFTEHEGLPRISQFTSTAGPRQVFLRFVGDQVLFKSEDAPKKKTLEYFRTSLMPHWAAERSADNSGYKVLKETPGYPSHLYYRVIWAVTQSQKKGDQKTKPEGFPTPLNYGRQEMVWIAPIRTKPRRTYDDISQSEFSPEGIHTPYLIRRILDSATEHKNRFEKFMKKAGDSSGMFESIRTHKYGDAVTSPFELDVVLNGKPLNIINVGYGVSQSLPVITEIFDRPKGTWFGVQQPEVHLHPRAQAALGDAFFDMAVDDDKHFVIETHSDFMIDRFKMNCRDAKGKRPDGQVLFFERRDRHNTVTPLSIGKDGELPDDQPDSYRKFFIDEEIKILEL